MECQYCGGLVEWQGKLVNLTHTECKKCGAVNSQTKENLNDENTDEQRNEIDNINPQPNRKR